MLVVKAPTNPGDGTSNHNGGCTGRYHISAGISQPHRFCCTKWWRRRKGGRNKAGEAVMWRKGKPSYCGHLSKLLIELQWPQMAMAMFNYSHTSLWDFQLFSWPANEFVGTTIFWVTVFSPFLTIHSCLISSWLCLIWYQRKPHP